MVGIDVFPTENSPFFRGHSLVFVGVLLGFLKTNSTQNFHIFPHIFFSESFRSLLSNCDHDGKKADICHFKTHHLYIYTDLRRILFFEVCLGEKSHITYITNPYHAKSSNLQDREQKQAGSYFLMEE